MPRAPAHRATAMPSCAKCCGRNIVAASWHRSLIQSRSVTRLQPVSARQFKSRSAAQSIRRGSNRRRAGAGCRGRGTGEPRGSGGVGRTGERVGGESSGLPALVAGRGSSPAVIVAGSSPGMALWRGCWPAAMWEAACVRMLAHDDPSTRTLAARLLTQRRSTADAVRARLALELDPAVKAALAAALAPAEQRRAIKGVSGSRVLIFG